jgi:glutamyl-tRNA reductase
MTLLVLGINDKTSPLVVREQLLFLSSQQGDAYTSLLQQPAIQGALLLSTCNRSEIYLQSTLRSPAALEEQLEQLLDWWSRYHAVPLALLKEQLYWHTDQAAVAHLMRVAVGLDSVIVGEAQILGQIKQAYHQAQQHQALTPTLVRLFQRVFYTAKQIRRETELGNNAPSVATLTCRLARQQIRSWSTASVLLIGAGETITLVAHQLYKRSVGQLILAVRNPDRATSLACSVKANLITLQSLSQWLPTVDMVISATSSPEPILDNALVAQSLQQRVVTRAPLILWDLAVPRDIAAEVAQLSGVRLYTIDDLQATLLSQQAQRQTALVRAEAMVLRAATEFMGWLISTARTAIIRHFREQSHQRRRRLEQQALAALQQGIAAERVVQQLAYQLTNQLLHQPTKLLQRLIQQPNEQLWQPLQQALDSALPLEKNQGDRILGS